MGGWHLFCCFQAQNPYEGHPAVTMPDRVYQPVNLGRIYMETAEIFESEIIAPHDISSLMSAYDSAREQLGNLREALPQNDEAKEKQLTDRLVTSLRKLMTLNVTNEISELLSYMIDRLSIRHSASALGVHPVDEAIWLLDNLSTVFRHSSQKNH
jgi:flagellin-specific chaperone FliS